MKNAPFIIAGATVKPGEMTTITLPAPSLYTQTRMDIPVHILHGKQAGPHLFIISSIHGDEINGVEIIRRLLLHRNLRNIKGTLICIPIANAYGFILQSRYLPDRRDLNRSFPGSKKGSLAARLANLYLEEIVSKCHYGIDLHTGALGRSNLPQIRVNLDTPGAEDLAKAFNVPVIVDAKLRDGSLRQSAGELGIPLLVYEAGEALRFDEVSIHIGIKGIYNILRTLKMLPASSKKKKMVINPYVAKSTSWMRAEMSGIVYPTKSMGDTVSKDEQIGTIHDPFGSAESPIIATIEGIIIGMTTMPLVNEGDALFNIASFKDVEAVAQQLSDFQNIIEDNE